MDSLGSKGLLQPALLWRKSKFAPSRAIFAHSAPAWTQTWCTMQLFMLLYLHPWTAAQYNVDLQYLKPVTILSKAKKKKKSVSQSCRPHLFFCAHLILQNSDFHFFFLDFFFLFLLRKTKKVCCFGRIYACGSSKNRMPCRFEKFSQALRQSIFFFLPNL